MLKKPFGPCFKCQETFLSFFIKSYIAGTTLVTNSSIVFQIDASELTKEQRTKIHEAVKKAFGTAIVGSTKEINGKKVVRFETYKKGGVGFIVFS